MTDLSKQRAGERVMDFIHDGMIVGLGSGSTAAHAIRSLGQRVRQGLRITAIPTSEASARLATELGIPLTTLERDPVIDLTFDGADEVDPQLDLIKGMGGALLREKVVASASRHRIILVDPSKLVERLGSRFPVPVEVVPFGWTQVRSILQQRGLRVERRMEGDRPYVTDNGNHILHCFFQEGLQDAAAVERWIDLIPGVVENGLFIGLADRVIVGLPDGPCRLLERPT